MAAINHSGTIFIISLLFFVAFSDACDICQPIPKPPPLAPPPAPACPSCPKPCPSCPKPPPLAPPPAPAGPSCPTSPPLAPAPGGAFCPKDTLKLGVCVDLLGLVNIVVGTPASSECCALLEGLADLEVAACLCTVIKANVLGINLEVPVALSVLLSACGKTVPPGFKCE